MPAAVQMGMAENIYDKVINFIDRYRMINENDIIVAGISGGADSVCMLHILWRLSGVRPFKLLVVHVDHGVRKESSADGAYVERLCKEWDIPFYLHRADMNGYAAAHRLSREEAGRQIRYAAFEAVRQQQDPDRPVKIAVAHNANDRAETMLFHLFRGSGIRGFASIRPVREAIIRPVLCLERAQIERYLKEQQLEYCHDITNEADAYSRNRIRHHILPYAEEEICHGAVGHMSDLADILSEAEEYLTKQAAQIYGVCVEESGFETPAPSRTSAGEAAVSAAEKSLCIACKRLLAEDAAIYKRVLLLCLERFSPHRKDITGRHIEELVKLMADTGSKELSLPYGITARKEYDRLFLYCGAGMQPGVADTDNGTLKPPAEYAVKPPAQISVPQEGVFTFTLLERAGAFRENRQNIPENRYTKWFDYDKITTVLLLRTRKKGDYLTIDAALHTKSVKQYMINEKIPERQRDSMYLLADASHVLWIPGYRISQGYKVDESTKRILQVQLRGGHYAGTS